MKCRPDPGYGTAETEADGRRARIGSAGGLRYARHDVAPLERGARCGTAVRDLASFFRSSFRPPPILFCASLEDNAGRRASPASLRDSSVANESASDSDSTLGLASVGSSICGRVFQGGLARREIDSESHDSNPSGLPSEGDKGRMRESASLALRHDDSRQVQRARSRQTEHAEQFAETVRDSQRDR
jgi:hypothetical protein